MFTPRRALITGINGQDGILLSRLLISKNYQVLGLSHRKLKSSVLNEKVAYLTIDVRNTSELIRAINDFQPHEIYNLASVSSVARSFDAPELTWEINSTSVLNLLESLKTIMPILNCRIFQASSSEMFGLSLIEPQDELTPFNPVSPYAEAKLSALNACREFRDRGFFIASGIMFNHESIYRPKHFITRKITSGVADIKRGKLDKLRIGNINAERDWGYAGDFVEAAWKMLQANDPGEYVIATGVVHSVEDLLEIAFSEAGLKGLEAQFLELNHELLRPREVNRLVGNASKIANELGWKPKKSFDQLIREMVKYDLSNNEDTVGLN